MIDQLIHLFRLDMSRIRYWFSRQRVAKFLVFLLSSIFFIGLAIIIEQISYYYFFSLHQYEPYGRLTAEYILHAALLVSLWFTGISSTVLAINHLWNRELEWSWLQVQPLSSRVLMIWHHIRNTLPNMLLLMLLWLPPVIGFSRVYASLPYYQFIPMMIWLTFLLTVSIQVIATSIAWFYIPQKIFTKKLFSWGAGLTVIGISILLLRSIFPTSLQALLRIDIDQFSQAFSALPLNQPWFFTQEFIVPVTNFSLAQFGLVSGVLILFSAGLLLWQSRKLRDVYAGAATADHSKHIATTLTPWYQAPLLWREVLSFFRKASETNFFLFFLGLVTFFFFFQYRALTVNVDLQPQLDSLLPFSLGTTLFLATAFLLRLVFPILAREAHSAWHTLSEPTTRYSLFTSKFLFSMFLSVLLIIITNIGWWLMPLEYIHKIWLSVYSSIGIMGIAFLHTLLSFWIPNWESGDQPDQISTSIQGFIALGTSLFFTAAIIFSWIYYQTTGWIYILIASAMILLVLFLLTIHVALQRYTVTR